MRPRMASRLAGMLRLCDICAVAASPPPCLVFKHLGGETPPLQLMIQRFHTDSAAASCVHKSVLRYFRPESQMTIATVLPLHGP